MPYIQPWFQNMHEEICARRPSYLCESNSRSTAFVFFLPEEAPFNPDLRTRDVPVPFRFLPRELVGLGATLSSSASWPTLLFDGCIPEWPKKSSPSSVHKSRTAVPDWLPAVSPVKPDDGGLSKLASWSLFKSNWTISLGFVTSVKFLFPTTISWTCKSASMMKLATNLWSWRLFWHGLAERSVHRLCL